MTVIDIIPCPQGLTSIHNSTALNLLFSRANIHITFTFGALVFIFHNLNLTGDSPSDWSIYHTRTGGSYSYRSHIAHRMNTVIEIIIQTPFPFGRIRSRSSVTCVFAVAKQPSTRWVQNDTSGRHLPNTQNHQIIVIYALDPPRTLRPPRIHVLQHVVVDKYVSHFVLLPKSYCEYLLALFFLLSLSPALSLSLSFSSMWLSFRLPVCVMMTDICRIRNILTVNLVTHLLM